MPSSFRQEVFRVLHSLSHPGIRATQRLIVARFVWPHVNTDVRNWAQSCLQCQRSKVQRHTSTPSGTFVAPDVGFDHVHMDIVGPLPVSQGFRYLLTVVDRFTRWPEAVPLMDITATSVARAFVFGWVSRFVVPSVPTTDRGRQFESTLLRELNCLLGCTRIRTTAYHPSANGLVERFHRQMKASLKACTATTGWLNSLPLVIDIRVKGFSINTASRADSAMLLLLRPLIIFEMKVRASYVEPMTTEPNQNSVTKCASPFSFRTKKIRARACERSSSQRHNHANHTYQTLHGALRITPCKQKIQMCCWTSRAYKEKSTQIKT